MNRSSRDILSAPIIIVGGGPVGLMLALFLDRHMVQSMVFNEDHVTRWHPKGSTHNSRTMEHYRRLGISEQVRGLGLRPDQHIAWRGDDSPVDPDQVLARVIGR